MIRDEIQYIELAVTVDHMRRAMVVAVTDHNKAIGQMLEARVKEVVTPENLARIIDEKLRHVLGEVVERTVREAVLSGIHAELSGHVRRAAEQSVRRTLKEYAKRETVPRKRGGTA